MLKRAGAAAIVLMWLAIGCGGGSATHTIRVDYSSDEFASFLLANFPKQLEVHPGDTLVIRQTWTGEPHTFTGGTEIDKRLGDASALLDLFTSFDALRAAGVELPDPENPGGATVADFARILLNAKPSADRTKLINAINTLRAKDKHFPDLDHPPVQSFADFVSYVGPLGDKMLEGLPQAIGDNGITQNGGKACYLRTGVPPKDDNKSCTTAQEKQPAFDGTQSYYSSGVIPYEGAQGNTYRVPLSKDIKPGTYIFFCAVHGPEQQTKVVVKPAGQKIGSDGDVTREAQKEINVLIEPLRKQFLQATRTNRLTLPGPEGKQTTVSGPFAGLIGEGRSAVNEFVPKQLTARAGAPITWKMMGAEHTIAFGVPSYFPQMEFLKNGTVRLNPKIDPPAGGAKKYPSPQGQNGPPGPSKWDGGTYSGTGFWSSGLIGNQPFLEYTMRIAKPGTYRVACLIHPAMVGTVVVTA